MVGLLGLVRGVIAAVSVLVRGGYSFCKRPSRFFGIISIIMWICQLDSGRADSGRAHSGTQLLGFLINRMTVIN